MIEWIEEVMTTLMSPERWPGLIVAIQLIIFLLCIRVIWVGLSSRTPISAPKAGTNRGPFIFLRYGIILSFAAFLIYQGTWQLTGHLRPRFVEFMHTHDKRKDNPAHKMLIGSILDRNGKIIAKSRIVNGKTERYYPYGKAFAHPIGHPRYTSTGLEKLALPYLAGLKIKDKSDLAKIGGDILISRPSGKGQDLKTTLDVNLQLKASEKMGKRRGAVMAMLIPSGDIVTMLSTPAFDPNTVDESVYKTSSDDALLLDRNVSGMVPPGSIFKVAMAGLALELGMDPLINCPGDGYTPIKSLRPIHDHQYNSYRARGKKWRGHGKIRMTKAIAESSNVYFARLLVEHVKAYAFNDLIERFQWRKPVGLYSSEVGRLQIKPIRVDSARLNDPYALAQMSIGQGTLQCNPGHMLLMVAAVANGGTIPQPRITFANPPGNLRKVLTPTTSKRLSRMMRGVVTEGTATGIKISGLEVAGKTGSAQNPRGKSHAWFVGFAPYDKPKMAICVLVENGGSGSLAALPVARSVFIEAERRNYFNP